MRISTCIGIDDASCILTAGSCCLYCQLDFLREKARNLCSRLRSRFRASCIWSRRLRSAVVRSRLRFFSFSDLSKQVTVVRLWISLLINEGQNMPDQHNPCLCQAIVQLTKQQRFTFPTVKATVQLTLQHTQQTLECLPSYQGTCQVTQVRV